jgi:hypothetical protein
VKYRRIRHNPYTATILFKGANMFSKEVNEKTASLYKEFNKFLSDNSIENMRKESTVQVVFLMCKIAELEERLEQSEIKEI